MQKKNTSCYPLGPTEQIKLGGPRVLFELKLCIVKVEIKCLQRDFELQYLKKILLTYFKQSLVFLSHFIL